MYQKQTFISHILIQTSGCHAHARPAHFWDFICPNFNDMLKNYFLTAIRHLQKQRILAFINVFGLSVGIACCSLLLLFASNEFGFDKFHKKVAIFTAFIPSGTHH